MKIRKVLVLALVLIMLLGICAGCSNSASTPSAESQAPAAQASGEQTQTDDQVYNIVLSYHSAETNNIGKSILAAAEYCEEKSNGRLKIEPYFSGTYVAKGDTMGALKTGMIDMAVVEATQIASVTVLNQVFNSLIQGDFPNDRAKVLESYEKMTEEIPELNEEMLAATDSFWLQMLVIGGYNLHGNKRIESIDDIKGLKIEAHGQLGQYMNLLGCTAVELESGDYYNGLKLNTVDAQLAHWAIVGNSQLNEVVKTHIIFGETEISSGLSLPAMGFLINQKTWGSLPADLQDILKEAVKIASREVFDADAELYEKTIAQAKEEGHEFIFIKNEDRKPWADAMQVILDEWFEKCEAAGYDGKATYNTMLEMFAGTK